jgi:uncharacterized protein YeaO (DUF488 family)
MSGCGVLRTASILSARGADDGLRVSVMRRHTLNDGLTPHPGITPLSFDRHWPELAASARLLGDYYKRGLPWEAFAWRYLRELRGLPAARMRLQELLSTLRSGVDVTLLCVEADGARCHRRLLAEECLRHIPELRVCLC